MDTRRLRLLLTLSQLGSMRAVADNLNLTTSTVSQQLAALAKETGAQLIEPEGRRVRLTPAGRRLADHAVTILAAVDAARLDLDSDAEPVGTLRVGGFATGIRISVLPILRELTHSHPGIEVVISEYEPIEAFALLTDDDLDLALTYDYNLAPSSPGPLLEALRCGRFRGVWDCARPRRTARPPSLTMPTGPGLSTRATPPTKTPSEHWGPWPDSHPVSPTKSTAWNWWKT
jgi:DNA-binding transcriptional LysR family regulator